MPNSIESVVEAAHQARIAFVNLQFTDVVGMVKSITVPAARLESVLERGVWFDGSSIEGFARVSESDMVLKPDPDTFAVIPWKSGQHATARLICNVYTPDGDRFGGAPRTALATVVQQAREMGYEYFVGPELEFFLYETDANGEPIRDATHDEAGYFDATADRATLVRQEMINAVGAFGIEVEAGHHEVAGGQHEIDFRYDRAIRAADNATTVKYAAKAVARLNGLYATFMPKPKQGAAGNGMHVHQSLADIHSGENLFYNPADQYGLSELAKKFIAGQLKHARAMCAVLSPLVNSYKRLVAGYEAPVYVSWARINRSALIRVPRALSANETRIELRSPDPACNPYLAFTVMLACGLDGIINDYPVPDPTEEDLFESEWARRGLDVLPGSLRDALDALGEDQVVQDALGPHIFERFMDAKSLEWDEYRVAVSQWELDRYLPLF